MKIPVTPPRFLEALADVLGKSNEPERFASLTKRLGPAPGGRYRHWDTFRHSPPLTGYSAEEQWLAVKLARQALYRPLPLKDPAGHPFQFAIPTPALEMLHQIDRDAGGNIRGSEQVTNPATRDTYLFKSVVEEAITSSQLEGASTTRKVAKALIQEGRQPRDRSERMIVNNYQGMLYVRDFFKKPLTPDVVLSLQKILTEGTLDDPGAAGRFRKADEDIVIEDETGVRLYTPPPARQLVERMERMCAFANGDTPDEFIPPAIRAIILHFWLAYDHPFVDGNGRTARALFYWAMARNGYWLCEYVSISRILKRAHGQYARSYLYSETDDNDLTYFVLYQLRVLLRAIDDLHAYLERKAAEMHEAGELVRRASLDHETLNERQLALINHALNKAVARYTVESHRISHGVSYETARSDLHKLVGLGLLDQRKAGKAYLFVPADDLRERLRAKGKR
jgi:Fic family protein